MRKIRFGAVCLGLLLLLSSCSSPERALRTGPSEPEAISLGTAEVQMTAPPVIKQNSRLVSDGETVALYCDFEKYQISVLDKCSGKIWDSAVDESKFDQTQMNMIWVRYMTSLVSIRAFNEESEDLLVSRYSNLDRGNTTQIVQNGEQLRADFNFGNQEIRFSMNIWLEDDRLCVSIDDDSIQENSTYRLMSIEPLPFFGAAEDTETGYTLIPDGSGAVMDYHSAGTRMDLPNYTFSVYSPAVFEPSDYHEALNSEKYSLSLPLFGCKAGDSAFLVQVTEGAEDAELTVSPSGNIVMFHRSAFKYNYRYTYNVPTTNIAADTGQAGSTASKYVTEIEKERVRQDRRQVYTFLRGETADYSGMAMAYQSYLIENGMLRQSIGEELPLFLNIFCSVMKEELLGNKLVEMTSFEDIREFEQRLSNSGIGGLYINLKGWNKGGYTSYVKKYAPESALGGKKGLAALLEGGSKYYLEVSPFETNESTVSRKEMLLSNDTPLSYNSGKTHYYGHEAIISTLSRIAEKSGGFGLSVRSVGSVLVKNPTRQAMADRLAEFLQEESKYTGFNLLMANEYLLPYADCLSEVPMKSSQLRCYDRDVPFYQMVIYGIIPYASAPLNLSYDMELEKLKLIEYGAAPCFELTGEAPVQLKDTDYNKLFTSSLDQWQEEVVSVTNELRTGLKSVWGSRMVHHSQVQEGVYKTEYSNGSTVYVNYNSAPVTVEGQTIEAAGYKVVEK